MSYKIDYKNDFVPNKFYNLAYKMKYYRMFLL